MQTSGQGDMNTNPSGNIQDYFLYERSATSQVRPEDSIYNGHGAVPIVALRSLVCRE